MEGGQDIGSETSEEAESRTDDDVPEVDERSDVHDFDFQDVPGLRTLDLDGTGERMHLPEIEREDAVGPECPGRRPDIQRISAQELDRLTLTDLRDGRDILVPSVVENLREAVDGPASTRRGVRGFGDDDVRSTNARSGHALTGRGKPRADAGDSRRRGRAQ